MEVKFLVKFEEEIPKYIQIANNIKRLIDNKEINDGEQLPPIRDLSKGIGVNNVTIVNAYKKLKNEGYAFQKVGSGTFAKRKDMLPIFNREYSKCFKRINLDELPKIIDFAGETSTEVYFPIDEFKVIINKVLDRDGANALIMQEPLGYEELRKTINQEFWENKIEIENILIVSGAQQGIDIASKAILNINDNVIVEKPTYGGALSVFKWRKANIFEVKLKEDGIDLEAFEEVLKKNKIRCFYTMSYFHNPTGISYSREKKIKLLALAKKYDFYIIEDDYLSELIYEENIVHEPFRKLDKNDRVIYIKSFSKIFLPGIRLGYIIAPEVFKESLQNSK
ncbi:MAG: PLP-dependent aminotransferase family protein, partial [Clostridium sp.]